MIDNVHIKNPSEFKISDYNITKSTRTAAGTMCMELVAKKKKFFFTYNEIDSIQKKNIMDLINGTNMFFTLSYIEDNITKTAVVYVGEIPRTKFRGGDGVWVWKGFSFDLIER